MWLWTRRGCLKSDDRLHRLYAGAQLLRQHALDLRQRPLDCQYVGRHSRAAGGPQAQGDRQRLVVGQHQGRQLEPAAQVIATVWPTSRLDWDAQVLQHRDIAPHGPAVDFQALGQLRAAQAAACLEQFQDRQDARGRVIHLVPRARLTQREGWGKAVGSSQHPTLSSLSQTKATPSSWY